MCLAQGPQLSDAGEALTRGLSVSSQELYHGATALPKFYFFDVHNTSPVIQLYQRYHKVQ